MSNRTISILCVAVLLIPWGILVFRLVRFAKKIRYAEGDFKEISGKKGEDRILAIDKLYSDKEKINRLLINNSLFRRKAYVLSNTGYEQQKKDLWGLIGSSALNTVLSFLFSMEFIKSLDGFLGILAATILIFVTACVACFIVYLLLTAKDTADSLLYRYELEYIDKVIESHINERLPNVKTLEFRKSEDVSYCRRFNAFIVKPQS